MYFTAYTSLVYLKLIKPRRDSNPVSTESPSTTTAWAPGTIKLQEKPGGRRQLHPVPTSDPNEPSHNLGVTFSIYTTSEASSYAGAAIGSLLLVPFVHKYSRRPLFLLSLAIQTGMTIWSASMTTSKELLPVCFVMGVSGSVSEKIVQNTTTDLSFVHQRVHMMVEAEGWRWMWWWATIVIGTFLLSTIGAFKETKYIPVLEGQDPTEAASPVEKNTHPHRHSITRARSRNQPPSQTQTVPRTIGPDHINPRKSDTPFLPANPGGIPAPAVAYAAIAYGIIISWVAIMGIVDASQLILPAWNFSPSQVGMIYLVTMVGHVVEAILAGTLSDYSIVRLAARNNGVFEPEMRLWVALPGTLISFSGLLVYGLSITNRVHWIAIAVGFLLYTTGLTITGTTALSYLSDIYQNIVGDALVAIVWVRNICPMSMMFALSPWLDAMGKTNPLHILAFVGLAVYTLPIALTSWGKRARFHTAEKYHYFTMRQATSRPIEDAS